MLLIFLCFAAAIFFVCLAVSKTAIKVLYPIKYEETVDKYSEQYGVEKSLVLAVIRTESFFDSDAVSQADARGLMQLLPETFDWLQGKTGEDFSENDLFDSEVSIKYGTYLLSILLDEFGEERTALAAYHAGRGRVNEWLGDSEISPDGVKLANIPYRDTAHYVSKVMKAKNIYDNMYN